MGSGGWAGSGLVGILSLRIGSFRGGSSFLVKGKAASSVASGREELPWAGENLGLTRRTCCGRSLDFRCARRGPLTCPPGILSPLRRGEEEDTPRHKFGRGPLTCPPGILSPLRRGEEEDTPRHKFGRGPLTCPPGILSPLRRG